MFESVHAVKCRAPADTFTLLLNRARWLIMHGSGSASTQGM